LKLRSPADSAADGSLSREGPLGLARRAAR